MTAQRPFRFGVLVNQARSAADWAAKARRAEALGYATLLMPDYIGPGLAPLPALAAAAASTRAIRLGTYVLANDFRNPVQTARDSATLDLLSDGRFELGLGAGRPSATADYRALGVPFDAPGARIARLDEALRLIAALLSGERVTDSGPRYHAEDVQLATLPAQQPRPPLLVAGSGRRILSLAARRADIVGIGAPPTSGMEALTERIGWLREAAGERFAALELNVSLVAVAPDPATAQTPPHLARMGVDVGQLARAGSPYVLTGSPDEMCSKLEALRATTGVSYIKADEGLLEALAPVVERLAGR